MEKTVLNFYIWGAGIRGKRLLKIVDDTNREWEPMLHNKLYDVIGFIDKRKDLDQFSGYMLFNLIDIDPDKSLIVLSMKNHDEAERQLKFLGYMYGKSYLYFDDFFSYRPLMFHIVNLLQKICSTEKLSDVIKSINLAKLDCNIDNLNNLFNILPNVSIPLQYRQCLITIVFASLIAERLNNNFPVNEIVSFALKNFNTKCFIDMIEMSMADKYQLVLKNININKLKKNRRSIIHNIAFYYPRRYNGGVERVITTVMNLLLRYNYNIYFFTQEITNQDYPISDGVNTIKLIHEPCTIEWQHELQEYINKYNIDAICVHSYDNVGCNFFLGLFMLLSGKYMFIELHNTFTQITKSINSSDFSYVFQTCDNLITLSQYDKDYWNNLGYQSLYIPNPIDMDSSKENPYFKHKKTIQILWVGRISEEQKQIFDIIDIMKSVVKRIPDAVLSIVGKSTSKDDTDFILLKERIKKERLDDNIKLEGFHVDVQPYYDRAKLVLMTSAYEGFPMVLAEAKKNGIPVCMYDLPYLELVNDSRGVMTASQKDYCKIADYIVELLANDKLRYSMSDDAYNSALNFASIDIGKLWNQMFRQYPDTVD